MTICSRLIEMTTRSWTFKEIWILPPELPPLLLCPLFCAKLLFGQNPGFFLFQFFRIRQGSLPIKSTALAMRVSTPYQSATMQASRQRAILVAAIRAVTRIATFFMTAFRTFCCHLILLNNHDCFSDSLWNYRIYTKKLILSTCDTKKRPFFRSLFHISRILFYSLAALIESETLPRSLSISMTFTLTTWPIFKTSSIFSTRSSAI